jgi:ribose transport system ATP-binding protein
VPDATAPLLEVQNIAKRYGPVIALKSVDLSVSTGEIHALLGANGAGKSTLVKILAGVFRQDTGAVTLNGSSLQLQSPRDSAAAGIATVFQDPALIPDLSIDQNLTISGLDRTDVAPWFDRLKLATLDYNRLVRDIPLATLRLIDLARALATDPQLLLLDEITAALTPEQADLVFDVMKEWKTLGRSVLFISHRLTEVLNICDTATILRSGVAVVELDLKAVDEAALVTAMLGEELSAASAASTQATADLARSSEGSVALEARSLSFGGKVDGISFVLRQGEVLGITGLEGQGQDELFALLSGDRQPESGEIFVKNEPLLARSPFDAISRGVVFVPGDRQTALFPQRSIRENLATSLYNRIGRWFALLRDEGSRVDNAVNRLDIDTRAASQVRRLSGGNQQKVTIGRWLVDDFDVVLCFDPTRGIDIQTKAQIYKLLTELASEGAAILFYSSELREIPLVCDRVLVIYDGQIVHEQDAASATEEVLLTAAHGLESASS